LRVCSSYWHFQQIAYVEFGNIIGYGRVALISCTGKESPLNRQP